MASIVDTSVKFAHSEMVGAPAINGVAGSLISVLDAFLVNGFGSKSVDSAAVAAGVCRLNFSSGASCADTGSVIMVEGAGNAALNGPQKVTAFSTSWVEFATDQADGPVTGTISFKAASLGWEKVFSATNTAVYRPTDLSSTRFYLKVTDTGTTQARVQMFESMTDINTGVNMMPNSAIVSGGYYWWKSQAANATAQQWFLAGDGAGLYFGCKPYASVSQAYAYVTQFAGDIQSVRSGDAYCGVLTGSQVVSGGSTASRGDVFGGDSTEANNTTARVIMRAASGVGSSQTCARNSLGSQNAVSGSSSGWMGPALNRADNGLYTNPVYLSDGGGGASFASVGLRGQLPGLLVCPQTGLLGLFGTLLTKVPGTGPYADKTLLAVPTENRVDFLAGGIGFIDITGPWR